MGPANCRVWNQCSKHHRKKLDPRLWFLAISGGFTLSKEFGIFSKKKKKKKKNVRNHLILISVHSQALCGPEPILNWHNP